ncbi:hypothetical protein Ddye_015417 [Dipteronia dyeriana]|uniref:Wall-associated receptor kinase galacturonan-binding domain-containing protein n=1 Tax=Dipteronia dyeriana TaxID=168575 RepID=A0AAD9WZ46_9ROSI|nr:hypothetical protein Ddye_015417 [Dipteronia dyeriana]
MDGERDWRWVEIGVSEVPQYCGRKEFELRCQDNEYHFIESAGQKFRVLSINDSHPTMIIARDDLWNSYCPTPGTVLHDTIFNTSLYKYGPNVRNLSLFHNCNEVISPESKLF